MVHNKKTKAILEWVAVSTSSKDCNRLSQLSSGKIFLQIIKNLAQSGAFDSDTQSISNGEIRASVKGRRAEIDDNNKVEDVVNRNCDANISFEGETDKMTLNDIGEKVPVTDPMDVDLECSNDSEKTVVSSIQELPGATNKESSVQSVSTIKSEEHIINSIETLTDKTSNSDINSTAVAMIPTLKQEEVNCDSDADPEEIRKRFETIKKFIDSILVLKSDAFVVYNKCIKKNENELAKLAFLLMAAIVQFSISIESELAIQSSFSGLDSDDQEEIKDILELFLLENKDHPVDKSFFQKRMQRSTTSRSVKNKSLTETPKLPPKKLKRKHKKNKNSMTEVIYETSNPFNSLLNSPNLRPKTPNSEDRLMEILHYKNEVKNCKNENNKLVNDLVSQEEKENELLKINKELSSELIKKENEIKELRARISETEEYIDVQKEKHKEQLAERDNEIGRLKKEIVFLNENIAALRETNTCESVEAGTQYSDQDIPSLSSRHTVPPNDLELKMDSKDEDVPNLNLSVLQSDFEFKLKLKDGKISDLQKELESNKAELEFYKIDKQMLKDINQEEIAPLPLLCENKSGSTRSDLSPTEVKKTIMKDYVAFHICRKQKSADESIIEDQKQTIQKLERALKDNNKELKKKNIEIDKLRERSSQLQNEASVWKTRVTERDNFKEILKENSINIGEKSSSDFNAGEKSTAGQGLWGKFYNKNDTSIEEDTVEVPIPDNSRNKTSSKGQSRRSETHAVSLVPESSRGAANGKFSCTEAQYKELKESVQKLGENMKSKSDQNHRGYNGVFKKLNDIMENLSIKNLIKFINLIYETLNDLHVFYEETIIENNELQNADYISEQQQNIKELKERIDAQASKIKDKDEKIEELQKDLTTESNKYINEEGAKRKLLKDKEILINSMKELETQLNKLKARQPTPLCKNCVALKEEVNKWKNICVTCRNGLNKEISLLHQSIKEHKQLNRALKHQIECLTTQKRKMEAEISVLNTKVPFLNSSVGLRTFFKTHPGVGLATAKHETTSNLRGFCKPEDEEDIRSEVSISESCGGDSPGQRLKECQRRNSLLPRHLRSTYPIELDTKANESKFLAPPTPTPKRQFAVSSSDLPSSSKNGQATKKRKVSNLPSDQTLTACSSSSISFNNPQQTSTPRENSRAMHRYTKNKQKWRH